MIVKITSNDPIKGEYEHLIDAIRVEMEKDSLIVTSQMRIGVRIHTFKMNEIVSFIIFQEGSIADMLPDSLFGYETTH